VTVVAVGTLVAALYGAEGVPLRVLGVADWSGMLAIFAWTALQARGVAAQPATQRAGARFWRFIAAAAGSFGAGSGTALVTAVRDPAAVTAPITTVHTVCIGVGALLLILGMVTTPLGIPDRRARVRFWLDAATVMVGVGLYAWQLGGFAQDGVATTGDPAQRVILPLIGPAALVVVAYGVVKIALGGTTPMTRPVAVLLMLAATTEGLNSAFETTMIQTGHPSWRSALGMVTGLLLAVGVRVQLLQARSGAARQRGPARSYSRLPYVAVAASYVLLIWVLEEKALVGPHAWVVLGGAIVGSGLVVARQLAAFADNDDLLARLNAKVRELAEAKEVLQRAVDERDALASRLHHLAYHDNLTGLANRALFLDRLEDALATRKPGATPTVIMIDLDDFKPVNDRYGHHAGDTLLRVVADRLSGCVRGADTVARLGGDEFAILLARSRPAQLADLVRRIGAAVRRPVRIGTDVEVSVRASVGTATAAPTGRPGPSGSRGLPGDVSAEVTALLQNADLEMYADKQLSKR
jgi:diguanylate cyclase (GGDEF)-like protein